VSSVFAYFFFEKRNRSVSRSLRGGRPGSVPETYKSLSYRTLLIALAIAAGAMAVVAFVLPLFFPKSAETNGR